jgi:phytoene dehydrogenase-like protein
LHGELGLDQLWVMRPTPRLAQGRHGIAGLFLGSDGMHPGVPLTLTPGMLAARRAAAWAASR